MAIAEAEPKKSDVAVTSGGVSDGIKDKVLNAGKNFVKNKGYGSSSSSTSVGTVKRYNLYDIKGFRFEMPDGWNDEDIALFVACCLEKKDDFSKENIDKTKLWASIAQSGAKKSGNPSLFTINTCLDLAGRLRYYVSKNMSILSDNESFMNFYSDVKSLLPHFSDNFVATKVTENEGNKKKAKGKAMNELTSELLNNDSGLGDIIHEITVENASDIRSGNLNVWNAMSSKLKERLGINTDSKTILETEKNQIISDVNKMEEKGVNKRDAFIERARGFIEVFDYINPKNIKVSNYLTPAVDSTMDSSIDFNGANEVEVGTFNVDNVDMDHKNVETSHCEYHNKEDVTTKFKKGKRGRPPKGRKTKRKDSESKDTFFEETIDDSQEFSSEPSSTTSFGTLFGRQKLDEQDINIIRENKLYNNKSKGETGLKTTATSNKSLGRKKKEILVPERIMPVRLARSKVVSYSLNRNSNTRSSKDINNCLKSVTVAENKHTRRNSSQMAIGIVNNDKENSKKSQNLSFDSDSEDTADNFNEFKKVRNVKSNLALKSKVANPDTTTDLDNKLVSKNLSMNEVPYLKKANRKRKDIVNRKQKERSSNEDELGTKVRRVHADSTMKNLVVKLVDCQYAPSSMDYPSHGSIVSLPKQQEKSAPFSNRIRTDRSKENRLIEETVVLAKDVVDSEYNPNSDSAKLVSDEHLNQGQHSNLLSEGKRGSESMTIPLAATSLKDSHQYSKSVDFLSPPNAGKHHVNPFCGISQNNISESSTNASVNPASGSSDNISLANRSLNLTSLCSKLQENTVSPYNPTAGSSSNVSEVNQKPSTSTDNLASFASPSALETALATLKKGGREFLSSQDNTLCISSSSSQNRFLAEIEGSKIPDWFENFITDYRKHEAWKIQQLLKMQQELADVELRKILLLEKIYGSLMKQ